VNRRALAAVAAGLAIAAVLAGGYAADGIAGLIDAAAVTTVGVVFMARGTVRGPGTARPVRLPELRRAPAAISGDDFPAYRRFASDLEWAQLSRRHYDRVLHPQLARIAASLHRPAPPAPAPTGDHDAPGPDLATLEHVIATLEEP
jgi:hypothetical protein